MKLNIIKLLFTAGMICIISCSSQKIENTKQNSAATKYKDGVYKGSLEKDHEGYSTQAVVKIENGMISKIELKILDNRINRYFDSTYEEIYKGNDLYIQQCRDNYAGMKKFKSELIEKQNIDEVDAITGATWCYNKFKDVMKTTLKEAAK